MIDKRIMAEIRSLDKLYLVKVIAAAIVAVTFIIFQAELISKILNDIFLLKQPFYKVEKLFYLLAGVIIVKILVQFLNEYYNKKMAIRVKKCFRQRVFNAFILGGFNNIRQKKAATITTQIQDGTGELEPYVAEFVPQIIFVAVSSIMVLIFVFCHDMLSGIIMLVTGPLIPFFMLLIGKMAKSAQDKQWKALQEINAYFLDILHGFVTLKIFNKTETQGVKVSEVSESFRIRTMHVLKISFMSAFVLEFMAMISTALVAVSLGLRLLYGQMGFQVAFLMLLLCPEFYQPIRTLGLKFHASLSGKSALNTLSPILESVKEENLYEESDSEVKTLSDIEIQIEYFSYQNRAKKVIAEETPFELRNIHFSLSRGEKIALTGISGSGKTTLVAIIMNIITNYKGKILVDGKDIRCMDKGCWNRYFAYVPQHPVLFKKTFLENLTHANPHASMEFVNKTIEAVGLSAVLEKLPQGFSTRLAEGGQFLSGGETQLLAIARALIKNTPIIIMDEPTSALDAQSEAKITEIIQNVMKDKMVIIIAHRLATLQNSGRILFLKDGIVAENGSPKELLEASGEYCKLVEETKRIWRC
ncbi:MAG: thiol reductant ABC exporter subunit CydD [Fusobacteria bacterium]|nr:thiol reductant ABC exporter subunit CydD [Fusobacteriota bacterium]